MTKEKETEKSDVESKEDDTKEEVEAPEEKEESKEESKEEKEGEDTKEKVDYKAIEKEENERKPDADKAKEAFNKREEKREDEEEVEKPLTEERMKEILVENNAKTQKVFTQNSAMQLAKDMSSSEAEAKAIIATWNNRIFPEGMLLEKQIKEMYLSVNSDKIISENSEVKRALQGRDNTSRDSASTHKDPPQGSEPKLSSEDAKGYSLAGLIWDGKLRLYKKELPNKKFMYKDPKTGKQWVA